jgi:methyl-accepting chemotaxis protein
MPMSSKSKRCSTRRYEKDFFLNIGKPEKQAKYIKKFDSVSKVLKNRLQTMDAAARMQLKLPAEVNQSIAEAQTAYNTYYTSFIQLTRTVLSDDTITPQQANKLMVPFKDHIYTFEKNIDVIVDAGVAHLAAMVDDASRAGRRLTVIILSILVAGALLIAVIAYLTVVRIRTGLTVVSRQLQDISCGEGDLTLRIDVKAEDEIGRLSTLFNSFLDTLQHMIRRISENASVGNRLDPIVRVVFATIRWSDPSIGEMRYGRRIHRRDEHVHEHGCRRDGTGVVQYGYGRFRCRRNDSDH